MARPALDKKLGKKQQIGKKRGRPPKAKPLQASKSKPQKKESVRTILRKAGNDKKEAKRTRKPKLQPQQQAAVKAEKKDDELTAAEPATQETVVNDGAPAEAKHASSVADYITGSWTYLSELVVGGLRFGSPQH